MHKHHTSLCLKTPTYYDQPKTSTATHVGVVNDILLQTVVLKISSSSGKFSHARILFDSGSQRSYISQELRKKLGCKTVRKERVILKTFGKNDNTARDLDVVQLFLESDSGESFCVEVLCVPLICSNLSNQNISLALKEFPNLRSLKLADCDEGPLSDFKVDVLVGVDFYHNFFTGKVVRTIGGPTANESVFGWVLSGPVCSKHTSSSVANICSTSHTLKCDVESEGSLDIVL